MTALVVRRPTARRRKSPQGYRAAWRERISSSPASARPGLTGIAVSRIRVSSCSPPRSDPQRRRWPDRRYPHVHRCTAQRLRHRRTRRPPGPTTHLSDDRFVVRPHPPTAFRLDHRPGSVPGAATACRSTSWSVETTATRTPNPTAPDGARIADAARRAKSSPDRNLCGQRNRTSHRDLGHDAGAGTRRRRQSSLCCSCSSSSAGRGSSPTGAGGGGGGALLRASARSGVQLEIPLAVAAVALLAFGGAALAAALAVPPPGFTPLVRMTVEWPTTRWFGPARWPHGWWSVRLGLDAMRIIAVTAVTLLTVGLSSPAAALAITPPQVDRLSVPADGSPSPDQPMRQSNVCATAIAAEEPDVPLPAAGFTMLNIADAWKYSTGAGVSVAVIDTGSHRVHGCPHCPAGTTSPVATASPTATPTERSSPR